MLFWLATTGYIFHRDVWPRLVADGPPPLRIDLVDEATSRVPVRWIIYRGDTKLGSLTTELRYVEADDTFWFDNTYRELRLPIERLTVYVPEAETGIRVTRDGDLREQKLAGKLELQLDTGPLKSTLATAEAQVSGLVTDGVLHGNCRVQSSPGGSFEKELDPVTVPTGQVLNPMMPVARIRDLKPGQRWVIRTVDPLGEALSTAAREVLKKNSPLGSVSVFPESRSSEVIATVRSQTETLPRRNNTQVECYVIDYRIGVNEAEATTWVAVEGGRVLRQEARFGDDTLRFERED